MSFCEYNGSVGKCGIYVENGSRCEKHKELPNKEIKRRGLKFSGYSKQREEEGYKTPGFHK